MEEELSKIIAVVAYYTKVCKGDILSGQNRKSENARQYVCHLIREGFPHLRKRFMESVGITPRIFNIYTDNVERLIESVEDIRILMNKMRGKLKLLPIKNSNQDDKNHYISNTKRMFGFDYTDEQLFKMNRAKHGAKIFMDKLCATGRHPLIDGRVFVG